MRMLKSHSGMSMIEVMIMLSVLAVISVGVIQMAKESEKTAKNSQKKSDIESVVREIQQVLATKDNCNATFQGANPGVGSGNRTLITSIKSMDSNGLITGIPRLAISSLQANDTRNNVLINGMYLENITDTGSVVNSELVITFLKNPKAAAGSAVSNSNVMQNYVVRKIPIVIDNCPRFIDIGDNEISGSIPPGPGELPDCVSGAQTGTPVGDFLTVTSGGDQFYMRACRDCSAAKVTVMGCL